MPDNASTTRRSMLIFLLVWLLSGAYLGANLNKGWVPHDEGTLGQAAERVMNGEMPHRDFHNPYTGGLTYIDAAIFKLFGVNLLWLRVFLFAVFLLWIPAVYSLARQFLSPWPAAGVTLVAAAWSVPNYPATLPSWFNLFLATFGTLALAKYIRAPTIHWLLLAGLAGGVSFLFKSVAIYYIAGALLFFVYREQLLSRSGNAPRQRTPLYVVFLFLSLAVFVLALLKLVLADAGVPQYLHFVFPGIALTLLLTYGEWKPPSASDPSRFKTLFTMAVPFLLASAAPVAIFAFYYWYRGALPALISGLFAGTLRQLSFARRPPTGLVYEYPAVIAALFVIEVAKLRGQPRRFLSVFLAIFAALVLFSSRRVDIALTVSLASVLGIIPVLVVAALLVLLARPKDSPPRPEANQQIGLFLSMTVLLSLIQFPYSDVTYFCYVATLVALLAASLISRFERPPRVILFVVVAFYVLFAATVTNVHFMGSLSDGDFASTPLALPRAGGIRVPKSDAIEYLELIPFIQRLAGNNPIFAGPDCPEVYFLSGLKNPTPFFSDFHEQPLEYEKLMRALLEQSDSIKVVVINESPEFSLSQLKLLQELVSARFPDSRKIGRFTVYWRP
jgi:hypothetical protein